MSSFRGEKMSHDNGGDGCSPEHRDNCKLLLREHSFCPRENSLSWTDVVQRRRRRRLLSLCPLFASLASCRVYPGHASGIWETVLKAKRVVPAWISWHILASYIEHVMMQPANRSYITRQKRKRYSVKSERHEGIWYILYLGNSIRTTIK